MSNVSHFSFQQLTKHAMKYSVQVCKPKSQTHPWQRYKSKSLYVGWCKHTCNMPLEQGISKLFHPDEVIIQAMIDCIVCKQTAQNGKQKSIGFPLLHRFSMNWLCFRIILWKRSYLVKLIFYLVNLKNKFKYEFKQQYSRSFQGRLLMKASIQESRTNLTQSSCPLMEYQCVERMQNNLILHLLIFQS